MADYQWFVIINQKKKGPFTLLQLKAEKGITPDTLAWRQGMASWTQIRYIPELAQLFKDENPHQEEEGELAASFRTGASTEGAAITLSHSDPPWRFWLLFFAIILAYALFQMFVSG
jgi:hypothetical protein